MRKVLISLGLFLMAVAMAHGQGGAVSGEAIKSTAGQAASVRVCTAAAISTPCTILADIYADPELSIPKTNPIATDALGNYSYYAAAGDYKEQITASRVTRERRVTIYATKQYVDDGDAQDTKSFAEITLKDAVGSRCLQTSPTGKIVETTGECGTGGEPGSVDGIDIAPKSVAVESASASAAGVSVNATTSSTSSAFPAGSFVLTVTKPNVVGYNGLFSSCINAAADTTCYAGSTMAIDATDGTGYTHTVAFNPQVTQSQTITPGSSGSDVYGVAAGLTLGTGVWPGSGMRVEGPVGAGTAGQVAVAFDMTSGISPVALFARPGCRSTTCNSAEIRLQGVNSGTMPDYSAIFSDYVGNLRFRTPGLVVVDAINGANATVTYNINSSTFALTANGWDGSKSTSYSWQILHNVNSPGVVSNDHLEIKPPDNLPGGATSVVVINTNLSATGNISAGNGSTIVYRCATAGTLPIGALTITAANCGSTADTGLRVK